METLRTTASQLPEEMSVYRELMGKLHMIVWLEVWSSTEQWALARYVQNLKDTDPQRHEKIDDLMKYIDTIPEYDRAYVVSHLLHELIKTRYVPFLEQKILEENDPNKKRRLSTHKAIVMEGREIQKQVKSAGRVIAYGWVATEYFPGWLEKYQPDIPSLDEYMIKKNSIFGSYFSWKWAETRFNLISPESDHGAEIRKIISDFLAPFLKEKYILVEKTNQYGELKQYITNLDGSDVNPNDPKLQELFDRLIEKKDNIRAEFIAFNKELQKKWDKQKNADRAIKYQQNVQLEELKKKLIEKDF